MKRKNPITLNETQVGYFKALRDSDYLIRCIIHDKEIKGWSTQQRYATHAFLTKTGVAWVEPAPPNVPSILGHHSEGLTGMPGEKMLWVKSKAYNFNFYFSDIKKPKNTMTQKMARELLVDQFNFDAKDLI
jgi:hypothetical protein